MNLYEQIKKARIEALRHNMKINSIVLNKNIALVREFWFSFDNQIEHVPRMICGLFAGLTTELPDDYIFLIYEDKNPPKTREEEIKAEARKEFIEELKRMSLEDIIKMLGDTESE